MVLVMGLAGLRPCPVGDPAEAPDGGGSGTVLDLGDSAAGAGGVDEPAVPPVAGQHPPFRVGVLGPDRFAAAGLIDPEHGQWRQRRRHRRARTWALSEACTMDRSMP
jgi:hypothetical protein